MLLLPRDPDASAADLRERLAAHFRKRLAVIITDSWGRAWRRGTVGVALGAAGLPALMDMRGRPDLFGHAAARDADRICRRDRQRRLAADGAGGRGAAGGAGARARLVGTAHAGRDADPRAGRGFVPMSAAGKRRQEPRRRAVRRHRRRQARARAEPGRAAEPISWWSPIPATTSSIWVCRSRPISTRSCTRSPASTIRNAAGAGATRPGPSWPRSRALGGETWFRLGDGDLATHVERTRRLEAGETLSAITADFCRRLGIATRVVPMTDDRAAHAPAHEPKAGSTSRTTSCGCRCAPAVLELAYDGAATARRASRCARGAARSTAARRRHLSVESVRQHRADPGGPRPAPRRSPTAPPRSWRCRRSSAAAP